MVVLSINEDASYETCVDFLSFVVFYRSFWSQANNLS